MSEPQPRAEEEYLAAFREAQQRVGRNQPLSTLLRVAATIMARRRAQREILSPEQKETSSPSGKR